MTIKSHNTTTTTSTTHNHRRLLPSLTTISILQTKPSSLHTIVLHTTTSSNTSDKPPPNFNNSILMCLTSTPPSLTTEPLSTVWNHVFPLFPFHHHCSPLIQRCHHEPFSACTTASLRMSSTTTSNLSVVVVPSFLAINVVGDHGNVVVTTAPLPNPIGNGASSFPSPNPLRPTMFAPPSKRPSTMSSPHHKTALKHP